MIAFIEGRIIQVLDNSVIVSVNGLGYEIFLAQTGLQSASIGQEVSYYLHHHIREDAQSLYGFSSLEERDLFRKMIGVSGIGPKSGLAAMSAAPIQDLIRSIQLEDHAIFQSVSGIGPKTAKRLVIELRSKVDWDDAVMVTSATGTHQGHIMQALEQLGYKPQEIQSMLSQDDYSDLSLDEAIKKILSQK